MLRKLLAQLFYCKFICYNRSPKSSTLENNMEQVKSSVSLKRAWLVCFVASLFFLFEFIQLSSFDALNNIVSKHFNLNASELSLLGSSILWGDVIFLFPAGFFLDRFGARKAILSSLFLSVLGILIFSMSNSFLLAFIARFMTGIGLAFCFIALVVLVSRWFPSRKQAFVMGALVNMAFLGGMFAHTPLIMLLHKFGWQHVMQANVLFGLGLLILVYGTVYDYPPQLESVFKQQAKQEVGLLASLKYIVNKQNIAAGLFTSCLNLPIMVLCALWGMQYLQIVHHFDTYNASNAISMIFLGSMVGSPLAGFLSDKIQKRKTIMWIGAICSLILASCLVLPGLVLSPLSMMSLFFALGLFSAAQVLSYPLIAESNLLQYSGRACSIASLIIMSGGTVAQIIFGYLLRFKDPSSTVLSIEKFQFAMYLFPASMLIAIFAICIIKETNCRLSMES